MTRAYLARKSWWGPALLGFVLAALLHGLYDFMVLLEPVTALPMAAAMIAGIWIWRLRLMRRMHEDALRESRRLDQPRS